MAISVWNRSVAVWQNGDLPGVNLGPLLLADVPLLRSLCWAITRNYLPPPACPKSQTGGSSPESETGVPSLPTLMLVDGLRSGRGCPLQCGFNDAPTPVFVCDEAQVRVGSRSGPPVKLEALVLLGCWEFESSLLVAPLWWSSISILLCYGVNLYFCERKPSMSCIIMDSYR